VTTPAAATTSRSPSGLGPAANAGCLLLSTASLNMPQHTPVLVVTEEPKDDTRV
jgi:hypothetical protein